jgi:F-type H+-transporting ATPase subunit b
LSLAFASQSAFAQEHAAPPSAAPGHGDGTGTGGGHGRGGGEGTGGGRGEGDHGNGGGEHRADAPKGAASGTAHAGAAGHGDAHGAAGAHGDAHGGHGPEPMNWTEFGGKTPPFIALLLNFGLLVALYVRMGKKPVQDGLKARRDAVASEIEEAQRLLQEAEGRAKVYQAKLANLEDELETAKKALAEAGKGERDRIMRDAEEKAERMRRDATFLIEQEVKQMRVDLTKEAVELALTAAEQVLKERITQQDQDRMADEFLRDVSTRAAAQPEGGAS